MGERLSKNDPVTEITSTYLHKGNIRALILGRQELVATAAKSVSRLSIRDTEALAKVLIKEIGKDESKEDVDRRDSAIKLLSLIPSNRNLSYEVFEKYVETVQSQPQDADPFGPITSLLEAGDIVIDHCIFSSQKEELFRRTWEQTGESLRNQEDWRVVSPLVDTAINNLHLRRTSLTRLRLSRKDVRHRQEAVLWLRNNTDIKISSQEISELISEPKYIVVNDIAALKKKGRIVKPFQDVSHRREAVAWLRGNTSLTDRDIGDLLNEKPGTVRGDVNRLKQTGVPVLPRRILPDSNDVERRRRNVRELRGKDYTYKKIADMLQSTVDIVRKDMQR